MFVLLFILTPNVRCIQQYGSLNFYIEKLANTCSRLSQWKYGNQVLQLQMLCATMGKLRSIYMYIIYLFVYLVVVFFPLKT
jgi:hypothetical protein